jgi:hypothetical protein
MKKTLTFLCFAALMVVAGTAIAENSLAVNGSAAIEGTYGLEVALDGDSPVNVFVQDDSPDNETVYRAQFMINMNDYSAPNRTKHALFKIRDLDGPINNHATLGIRQDAGGLILYVKIIDGSNPSGIFRSSDMRAFETNLPSGVAVEIMIEFVQGSSNDGIFRLYKNGSLKREHTGLNNPSSDVDRVQLGAIGVRSGATPSGSYYLDSFESYRTLAP